MKKLLFFAILVGVGLFGYQAYSRYVAPQLHQSPSGTHSTVQIRDATYQVDVADEDSKRAQGLSGRTSLDQNQGMLFVFDTKAAYSFWMKDMKFPLDFIWIDGNKIADLTENVAIPLTDTYTPSFHPNASVNKVLEINAGEIKLHGFQIGDQVSIILLKPQSN